MFGEFYHVPSPLRYFSNNGFRHVINMMDILISFAIGLPALVRRIESDTRGPRNLLDSDISPNATKLPKERPPAEITPASYTISKSRVCAVFAEAAELSSRIVPPKHSHIMTLNKRLVEAHELIPEGMRVRPMEDCITEPPVLIMSRFNIELLYQKTRIVLHRNYLTAAQTDIRFAESRSICLDAALETLRYQNVIFHACQPGGQLNKVWWYMSSLNTYDFLLASMILCLELNHLQTTDINSPKIAELLELLENTHGIWANNPNRFRESARGAEILKAMLKKYSERAESHASKSNAKTDVLEQCMSPTLPQVIVADSSIGITQPTLELTPESISEELPPQIWGAWPVSGDDQPLDMPDIPSEIDWVSNTCHLMLGNPLTRNSGNVG